MVANQKPGQDAKENGTVEESLNISLQYITNPDVVLREEDAFRVVAMHNAPPAFEDERRNRRSVRRFGGEMNLPGDVTARAGFSSPPLNISFGIGLAIRGTGVSVAVVQHEVLGATPYATISFGRAGTGTGRSD